MSTSIREIPLDRSTLARLAREGGSVEGVGRMRAIAALRRARTAEIAPLFVALGLGRIGSPERLGLVERLAEQVTRASKAKAAFAATLLAYRHRLSSRTAEIPRASDLLELGRAESRTIRFESADRDTAALALRALAGRPLDVSLVTDAAQLIHCEPNVFVWLWNKEALAHGPGALDANAVAGALFRRNEFDKTFSLSAIAFATPQRGAHALTLHRPDSGRVLYAGTVDEDGTLSLQTHRSPGAAAIVLKARLDSGRIEASSAESTVRTAERKTPERG